MFFRLFNKNRQNYLLEDLEVYKEDDKILGLFARI